MNSNDSIDEKESLTQDLDSHATFEEENESNSQDCVGLGNGETQNQELSKKIAEYEEVIRRQQAEFDNFRKRTERERIEFADYASFAILKDLLAVKDSFDSALSQSATTNKENSMDDFLAGFKLVSDQLHTVFQKYEVSQVPGEGSPFNPTLHQSLRFEEDESVVEDTVGQVYQKGYLFKKKLLREASVCVRKPVTKQENVSTTS